MQNQIVKINSRKFNGNIHRSWQAEFIEQKDSLLVFVGKFKKEIKHANLGIIRRGTVSYEYYWLDRWFNIFVFFEPEGTLRNFYCNINLPPKFEDGVLDYIDLDVDLLVWSDFSFEILDCEEFKYNAQLYGYSRDIIIRVEQTVDELKELIQNRGFPFS